MADKKAASKISLPDLKEFLKAGVQFGHETKRWNPKFAPYLFGSKQDIHIIDLSKTVPLLEKAGDFLAEAASRGPILFLGTKKQASQIVREKAVEAGAHFIDHRWAGGFLTNFKQITTSLKHLKELEKGFEEGIVGRTKYEISQMKKDWDRLNRLYGGVKQLEKMPAAVFVIDPGFESGPVRECNYLDIPVVAIVDSNSDPNIIDYPIPANDDALGSISLIISYLTDRIKEVDSPYKVKHTFKDYSKAEVEIKRTVAVQETREALAEAASEPISPRIAAPAKPVVKAKKETKVAKSTTKAKQEQTADGGGILSKYQQQREKGIAPRK